MVLSAEWPFCSVYTRLSLIKDFLNHLWHLCLGRYPAYSGCLICICWSEFMWILGNTQEERMTEVEIGWEGSIWGGGPECSSQPHSFQAKGWGPGGEESSKVAGPIKNSCMDGPRPLTPEWLHYQKEDHPECPHCQLPSSFLPSGKLMALGWRIWEWEWEILDQALDKVRTEAVCLWPQQASGLLTVKAGSRSSQTLRA